MNILEEISSETKNQIQESDIIKEDIIEMIEALDKIAPGIANDETLLYGIEVKFYSNKIKIDKNCETSMQGLYAIGDSSGWTRGLMIASVMGTYVAERIYKTTY